MPSRGIDRVNCKFVCLSDRFFKNLLNHALGLFLRDELYHLAKAVPKKMTSGISSTTCAESILNEFPGLGDRLESEKESILDAHKKVVIHDIKLATEGSAQKEKQRHALCYGVLLLRKT